MDYLMAFDVGTSGAKAALTDMAGHVLHSDNEPLKISYPRKFCVEQDPEEWWRGVCVVSRRLLDRSGINPKEVAGMAFSGQGQSILFVDADGRPLAPSMIWMDNRAGEEAKILMNKLGGPMLFEAIIGGRLTGNFSLSKYLWAKRQAPDLYRQTKAFMDQSSYLFLRSTGQWICEWTQASTTGLFNLKSKHWDTMVMRLFGLDPNKFLPLKSPIDRIGGLTKEASAALGLIEGMPVFGGAVDAMAAGAGTGAASLGSAFITLGTSGALGVLVPQKLKGQDGLATAQSADPTKLLYIGGSNTSGSSLSWAAKNLYGEQGGNAKAFEQIGKDIKDIPAGSGGLLFGPWLAGERAPYSDDSLRGCFINLNMNHSRAHLIRAIGEGVAHNYKIMIDSAERAYKSPISSLRMVGGGASYLSWMQVFADISGKTLEVVRTPSFGATMGAALLAAVGLGVYPSVEQAAQAVEVEHRLIPDEENHKLYANIHEAYKEIYPSLRKLYAKLNPTEGK